MLPYVVTDAPGRASDFILFSLLPSCDTDLKSRPQNDASRGACHMSAVHLASLSGKAWQLWQQFRTDDSTNYGTDDSTNYSTYQQTASIQRKRLNPRKCDRSAFCVQSSISNEGEHPKGGKPAHPHLFGKWNGYKEPEQLTINFRYCIWAASNFAGGTGSSNLACLHVCRKIHFQESAQDLSQSVFQVCKKC